MRQHNLMQWKSPCKLKHSMYGCTVFTQINKLLRQGGMWELQSAFSIVHSQHDCLRFRPTKIVFKFAFYQKHNNKNIFSVRFWQIDHPFLHMVQTHLPPKRQTLSNEPRVHRDNALFVCASQSQSDSFSGSAGLVNQYWYQFVRVIEISSQQGRPRCGKISTTPFEVVRH